VSYSFYPVWADLFQIPYETPALDADFKIRKEDYYKENGGVIFPNPNAPTGLLLPLNEIEDILQHNQDCVVIVDEAYIDFGGVSALPLLEKYENLLVVQTFSKSRSMAGMRIGYAIGAPALIKAMSDVKYSFNSYTMNLASLQIGVEAVKDEAYFQETTAKIVATRERAKVRFSELGFSFPDSMANFIFVTHERVPAKQIFEALKAQQIYVRYFAQPRLENYLRVTVGTDAEMDELFAFLEKYLKENA
jgi:histidinol-phosphate aminotransferase